MAQIVISFETDEQYRRVVDGIGGYYQYEQYVSSVAEGETTLTKEEFAKKQVIDFMGRTVKNYESAKVAEEAKATAEARVDDELTMS